MAPRSAIGVDIGGSFTKIALVGAEGAILRDVSIPSDIQVEYKPYLERLISAVASLITDEPPPLGIGMALPGFLADDRHSITFNPNTPALVGVDMFEALSPLGLPLAFEQDLNVPALAEYYLGAGRDVRRLMSGTIGTGLGAAMIIDGELLRFSSHTIGDSGHIVLDPEGPTCLVGCHGCAEALTAVPAVEREAIKALADPRSARLRSALQPDGRIPASAVIKACQQGDPLAGEIMAGIGRWLGQWLACLAPVFLPERIVLCGGISEAGEALLAACRERFYEITGPEYARCDILLGKYKGYTGVIGAAIPFLIRE